MRSPSWWNGDYRDRLNCQFCEIRSDPPSRLSPVGLPTQDNGVMHVSAKVDYAMRALLEIARETDNAERELIKGDQLAKAQQIPARFLEGILRQLRQAGIVASQRGAEGGYRLARSPAEITVADVVRALDGPLADVRGDRPENAEYNGAAEHLKDVWVATRAALRGVLEHVTLADIASGNLPSSVTSRTADPSAWS
jgi:Rrf2 family protein